MKLVILESPYTGDIEANVAYARRAVRHSLSLGEAPIALHLLYTQLDILNDENMAERKWGIEAGLAWKKAADHTIFYLDKGLSNGMKMGLREAIKCDRPIYGRWLDGPVNFGGFDLLQYFFDGCASYK